MLSSSGWSIALATLFLAVALANHHQGNQRSFSTNQSRGEGSFLDLLAGLFMDLWIYSV